MFSKLDMLYHFELQMAGVILLTAMAVGGISLMAQAKKRTKQNLSSKDLDES